MSYTKTCNSKDCGAQITWNEEKEWYEDELFPGQKHDHKKFKAAAPTVGGSVNSKQEKIEGTVCNTCARNGFPNEIIFFNDAVRGHKSNKVIPLEHAEKVNGEYVFHEHKTKDSQDAPAPKQSAAQPAAQPEEKEYVPPVSGDAIPELMKSWIFELRNMNQWFKEIKPQIETAIGYINAQSVKTADNIKNQTA